MAVCAKGAVLAGFFLGGGGGVVFAALFNFLGK